MPPHPKPAGDNRFRPPLFSSEEWRRIVADRMLSPRHAEVAGLVIQSKSDKEIAKLLGIKQSTVRAHLKECNRRLESIDRVNVLYRVVETFRRLFVSHHQK